MEEELCDLEFTCWLVIILHVNMIQILGAVTEENSTFQKKKTLRVSNNQCIHLFLEKEV